MAREFLIYFHPDKYNGYGGCYEDRYPNRVIEQGLDVSKAIVVESGLCLEDASRRERELQLRDGYRLDKRTLKDTILEWQPKALTKQSQKKRVSSYDWNKHRRGIRVYRVDTISGKLRGSTHVYKKTYIKTILGMCKAAKELGIESRDISACCRGRQKTAKGYTFEYA